MSTAAGTVVAIAAVMIGWSVTGSRAPDPATGIDPQRLAGLAAQCRRDLPADVTLRANMGAGSDAVLLFASAASVYVCDASGDRAGGGAGLGTHPGDGFQVATTVSSPGDIATVFGQTSAGVTAIDVVHNGQHGEAALADGYFVWLGGTGTDHDAWQVTEHGPGLTHTWMNTGPSFRPDDDPAAMAAACRDAAAPLAGDLTLIAAEPSAGTALLAGDRAVVACDDGVTNVWRPTTPWSAQSTLVDLGQERRRPAGTAGSDHPDRRGGSAAALTGDAPAAATDRRGGGSASGRTAGGVRGATAFSGGSGARRRGRDRGRSASG